MRCVQEERKEEGKKALLIYTIIGKTTAAIIVPSVCKKLRIDVFLLYIKPFIIGLC